MMHSKIYYIERASGDVVAFVGSNNLTQYALGGANCEAAVRLQGNPNEPEFQEIRHHIEVIAGESSPFDPSKIDMYAAENTRILQSMIDESDSQTGLIEDPAIILAAIRKKTAPLPKRDEKLYFEVPLANEEYSNYSPGKRIELHLLLTGLSRNLREVVGRSFKCYGAEVTMVDRTGLERTRGTPATTQKVDWIIEESPAPTLWHRSKLKPPSRALQIVAVFLDEIPVKYDYYRSAPPLKFTSEVDRENPIRLRERLQPLENDSEWKEIPTGVLEALAPYLDKNWFLVRDLVREKQEEGPLLSESRDQYVWRVKYRRARNQNTDTSPER
jgi:hypothetical protein